MLKKFNKKPRLETRNYLTINIALNGEASM